MGFPVQHWLQRLNPRRHLGARLALAAAFTVLVLSLALSGLVGYVSSRYLHQAAQQSLHELAFQMADKLDRGMFERYRDIRILTQLKPIGNPQTPAGEQRALLEQFQQSYPDYAWIGLTDATGKVIASTGGLLEGANVQQRPWFQQARFQPFVGDVHEALLLEELLPNDRAEPLRFVDISVPVQDGAGQFIGVLGAHLSWRWAEEIQQSLLTPMGEHGQAEIFILDGQGKVLLKPTGAGKSFPENFVETVANSRQYVTGIAQTQGYRDYPGLNWQVFVRQFTTIALAPARALQGKVLGVGLLLGLVTALWHSRQSHRIVNPMVRLSAAADAIRQGHADATIPTFQRQDEIANLATSLQDLLNTTRQQQARLLKANHQLQEDIQRQRQDAATIQEQAALLNIATDAIIVRDLDWHIRFWNRGAERIYGWLAEEVCGQNAHALLNRDSSPALEAAARQVVEQGTWRGELTKVTKSGQERTMASRWDLVCHGDGSPKAILTVETDITEKKQMEEQLLRTQRLESLGTLAGGIAHDLNNIFAPILMAAQLLPLKLPDLSDHDRQLVDTLNASARRGSSLVQQILSFARGLAGERTQIQPKHVLSEVRQICRSTFPKRIDIDLRIKDRFLWMVNADANQLHQVLMNLCVNARDAMPDGGKLILQAENLELTPDQLQGQTEALPGAYVKITVQDEGTGMPPEVVNRIFDPFFTTKEVGQGTGLGLATTLGIVKRHGGFMDVQTQIGIGTQFHLYLPAVKGLNEDVEAETQPLPQGQNQLILLVDDEQHILETTKASLATHHYRVLTASNGFEAIERYTQYQSDIQLVLTDMQMPDMSGEAMVRVLRILNPAVKVIAASGSREGATDEPGCYHFLQKPFSLETLLQAVHQTLGAEPEDECSA